MGINGFFPQCKKLCGFNKKDCKSLGFEDLRGSRIVFDGNGQAFIYKNRSLHADVPLVSMYYLSICKMYEYNILPIIIFDGERNELKATESADRKKTQNKSKERYLESKRKYEKYQQDVIDFGDDVTTKFAYETANAPIREEYIKRKRNNDTYPRKEDYDKIKELLRLMRVPFFVCNKHEAELLCVKLEQHHLVDYVCSEDTDVLMNGVNLLMGHISHTHAYTRYIHKPDLTKSLGFKSNEQFMHHFLMYKTDVMPKINIRFYKDIYKTAMTDPDYGKQKLIDCHGIEKYKRVYRYFNPQFEDVEGSLKFCQKLLILYKRYDNDIKQILQKFIVSKIDIAKLTIYCNEKSLNLGTFTQLISKYKNTPILPSENINIVQII